MSKRARDETTTSARDLVEIKLVGAEAFPGETSFAPDYVHQIFEDEKVGDVSPELRLECLFNDVTLDVCLRATGAPLRGAAEDALYTLAGALPTAQTESEFAATLQRPPPDGEALVGPLLGEYTRGGRTFRIHCGALHAAAQAPSFMRGLQALMRFYIETWSDVDEDERWRVVAVFEAAERPRLVAAATIFHFQRWLTHADALPLQRAAGPALVVRLCQAIVMPQFRSQGHGAQLLQAVYTHAHAEGAIELTVEDPNPRFRMVRDVVDYRNCHSLGLLPPDSLAAAAPLEAVGEARRKLLLTHEQATRCHELRQYVQLAGELAAVDEADTEAREAVVKPWRLKVKRRLSRQHQEELDPTVLAAEAEAAGETLSAAELVERRKARLEELYEETVGEYRLLSHRLGVAAHKKA
ncbi:hypothetical protein AB1Y20_022537 [Prymnesium parvum]|uniref:histone acetyltransferase n=1 Tax=Prymnesium parvum TaxID=97485 RepID=A0AB34JGJ8_PRYPA